MVLFNELRISEDGNNIIIDCEIDDVNLYSGMYIKKIYLDYYTNVTSSTIPSSKAYVLYENGNDDATVREKRIVFPQSMLSVAKLGATTFDNGLFYVVVCCDGNLPSSAALLPCGYDNTTDIGIILDWKSFYANGMSYVAGMLGECSDPCADTSDFEHYILLWNALRLAIDTCDWTMVSKLWKRFLLAPSGSTTKTSVVRSNCGCHS